MTWPTVRDVEAARRDVRRHQDRQLARAEARPSPARARSGSGCPAAPRPGSPRVSSWRASFLTPCLVRPNTMIGPSPRRSSSVRNAVDRVFAIDVVDDVLDLGRRLGRRPPAPATGSCRWRAAVCITHGGTVAENRAVWRVGGRRAPGCARRPARSRDRASRRPRPARRCARSGARGCPGADDRACGRASRPRSARRRPAPAPRGSATGRRRAGSAAAAARGPASRSTSPTWIASSRVGTSTSAWTPRTAGSTPLDQRQRERQRLAGAGPGLPDDVVAVQQDGIAWAWIGVGTVMPIASTAARVSRRSSSSANEVSSAEAGSSRKRTSGRAGAGRGITRLDWLRRRRRIGCGAGHAARSRTAAGPASRVRATGRRGVRAAERLALAGRAVWRSPLGRAPSRAGGIRGRSSSLRGRSASGRWRSNRRRSGRLARVRRSAGGSARRPF